MSMYVTHLMMGVGIQILLVVRNRAPVDRPILRSGDIGAGYNNLTVKHKLMHTCNGFIT